MNASQAQRIYYLLLHTPDDHPFWTEDYTKEQCFADVDSIAYWYIREKQYHWAAHWRRDIIDKMLEEEAPCE